jgi:sugar phosphate isomerase/epimerase
VAKITALSTLTYPDQHLGDALGRIKARGFRAVDIAHMGYYCRHFPLGAAETEGIRGMLRTLALQPIALNFYGGERDPNRPAPPRPPRAPHKLNVPGEAEHYTATMQRAILQCRSLGIPLLMAVPGRRSEEPDRREEVEAAARVISALGDEAYRNGLRLTVEAPHCYSLLNTPERTAEFFALLTSSHVGATVDSSHWGVLRYDLEGLWAAIGPRIWHVHLRDSAGTDTADFRQQLELTPGRGEVDFARLAAWLDRHRYRGNVTLELEYVGRPLDEIEAGIDFALRHLAARGWELPAGVPAD